VSNDKLNGKREFTKDHFKMLEGVSSKHVAPIVNIRARQDPSVPQGMKDAWKVEILDSDNVHTMITRREALHRARALVSGGSTRMDLIEALVKSANEARKNELGSGYSSAAMEMMLKTAQNSTAQAKREE
jgi:hypothetical protein